MAKVKLTEAQLQKLKDSVIKKELEKTVPYENTPEVKTCKELGIGMLFFLGKNLLPTNDEILQQAISLSNSEQSNE